MNQTGSQCMSARLAKAGQQYRVKEVDYKYINYDYSLR